MTKLRQLTALATAGLVAGLAGCGDGAFDPAGRGASEIADLWWLMFWLSLIPIAIVLAAIAWIMIRRRRGNVTTRAETKPDERPDRRTILIGGIILPIVLLVPVAVFTVATAKDREADGEALEIELTGRQFWWDVRYPAPGQNALGRDSFRSANEIHVPVGRPVELIAESADVIHSFWVPQLDGKIDLIPGRENRLRIEASEPGTYEGRCAEFCGLGHTMMRIRVIAHSEEEFEQWRTREAGPALVDLDAEGRELFSDRCGPCHVLRGQIERPVAQGTLGPDLTHVGSRDFLAAGAIPNTREGRARWITDPQGVKPGNLMPWVGLDAGEVDELVELIGELE